MPSLKAIRKRIASVKNTKKITSAMKLVAAARLRRAQDAIVSARPYANRLVEVIADLAARVGEEGHPLLAARPEKQRIALIILTSDRGLCGGFNSNVLRRTERFLIDNKERFPEIDLLVMGRKGREYMRRRPAMRMKEEWPAAQTSAAALSVSREMAKIATERFLLGSEEGGYDAVYLVYNEFKSAISQHTTVAPLLPVERAPLDPDAGMNDFAYEPSRTEVLSTIVPMYIQVQIYRALLETVAGFFGAQMSAMDSATKNAAEMIGSLTLQFNRARQAAITKELMEIVGGAEALKG